MIEESKPFVYLTIKDVENIVTLLIEKENNDADGEAIPPFHTRYPNKLESILTQIQVECFGEPLFPDLISKSARLFYGLAKQHPFINGNKRMAILILIEFLRLNEAQIPRQNILSIEYDTLFEMVIKVSHTIIEQEDETMEYLKNKIKTFILK
jgi:death-on-curing protein